MFRSIIRTCVRNLWAAKRRLARDLVVFVLGILASTVLPYEYSEWRSQRRPATLKMALGIERVDEAKAVRLGVPFDARECPNDECAAFKLAFFNTTQESVNNIQMLCSFSGAIIGLNALPVVSFLDRDGTPILHPMDRVLYRNNVVLRIAGVPAGSYVIQVFLVRRGIEETLHASCTGLKGESLFEKVEWTDMPAWVPKGVDSPG